MITYTYKGTLYQITSEEEGEFRAEQIVRDFEYCAKIGDYTTITHRMINGIKYGWAIEIKK